jgi:hypothetical protein
MSEEVYRGEPGEEIEIKVDARLPGGWRRSSRCKRGHRNFRDGSTQAGTRCLKRRKKGQQESSECKHFCSTNHTRERKREGKKGKNGGWVARALQLTRIAVVRSITGSQHAPAPARGVMAVFESCILKMQTEGGVSSRELATPAVCDISTSTK